MPRTDASAWTMADIYNTPAVPEAWVYRESLLVQTIYEVTTPEGTSWAWPIYSGRTVADRDCWREMTSSGTLNPSLGNTRKGIDDLFPPQGQTAPQHAHLLVMCRMLASRSQRLFATGPGTTAQPATMGYPHPLQAFDITEAWSAEDNGVLPPVP